MKKTVELQKVQEAYNAMKSREFQARRGRNNRIYYKSQVKTIYGYDSSENDEVC